MEYILRSRRVHVVVGSQNVAEAYHDATVVGASCFQTRAIEKEYEAVSFHPDQQQRRNLLLPSLQSSD